MQLSTGNPVSKLMILQRTAQSSDNTIDQLIALQRDGHQPDPMNNKAKELVHSARRLHYQEALRATTHVHFTSTYAPWACSAANPS
jgi:hypothetical protein